jgi:hypothetical protein
MDKPLLTPKDWDAGYQKLAAEVVTKIVPSDNTVKPALPNNAVKPLNAELPEIANPGRPGAGILAGILGGQK